MKKNFTFMLCALLFSFTMSCLVSSNEKKIKTAKRMLMKLPSAAVDGFTFPVGPPHAKGYYNAQKFGKRNSNFSNNFHLGEDWNGIGGGNSDLGDPVYSVAHGIVTLVARDYPGWGNVVLMAHRVPGKNGKEDRFLESVYGHLDSILVKKGAFLIRGSQVGTIGNAGGLYYAHLHFELRSRIMLVVGGGYDSSLEGFLHPTMFIKKHHYLKSR